MFLSAVTLKIRSRSHMPNQGFGMSKCYTRANFGQNPIIRSGYMVHILRHLLTLVPTTTPTPTGSASKNMYPTVIFFVGVYELSHSLFSICRTNSRKEDIKHVISGKTSTFSLILYPQILLKTV